MRCISFDVAFLYTITAATVVAAARQALKRKRKCKWKENEKYAKYENMRFAAGYFIWEITFTSIGKLLCSGAEYDHFGKANHSSKMKQRKIIMVLYQSPGFWRN